MSEEGNWEKTTPSPPGFPSWLIVIPAFLEFHLNSTKGSATSHLPSSSDELKPHMCSSSGGLSKDGDEVAAPWALRVDHCS